MLSDSAVHVAFIESIVSERIERVVQCRHCSDFFAKHTSRQRAHLVKCFAYLRFQRTLNHVNSITRKVENKLEDTKSIFNSFASEKQKQLDQMTTQIIYCDEWSLSLFQNSWMHEFFIKSIEYTSSLYNRIAETLLNETFKCIKEMMNQLFDEMNFLNIISDESNNQPDDKILNMCVLMKNKQFFHAFSKSIDSMRLSAANTTVWMLNKMNILTHEDFRKINSVIIDTCNLKQSVWNNLAADARLKHVFFVLCNSYDLQLLLKDFLYSSLIRSIFIKTLKIVNSIWKIKHQLDILRRYQKKIYDQHKSLIVFTILRWETQIHLIESLVWSKVALQRYATDDETNFTIRMSKFLLRAYQGCTRLKP